MATKKRAAKLPKLVIVPEGGLPPPSAAKVRRAQREAAQEAIKDLEEGRRHLFDAQNAFDRANARAVQHRLPGAQVRPVLELDGSETLPELWEGARKLDEEMEFRRRDAAELLGRELKRLKNKLTRFLRDTKGSAP